jgi:hypothetical protein
MAKSKIYKITRKKGGYKKKTAVKTYKKRKSMTRKRSGGDGKAWGRAFTSSVKKGVGNRNIQLLEIINGLDAVGWRKLKHNMILVSGENVTGKLAQRVNATPDAITAATARNGPRPPQASSNTGVIPQ